MGAAVDPGAESGVVPGAGAADDDAGAALLAGVEAGEPVAGLLQAAAAASEPASHTDSAILVTETPRTSGSYCSSSPVFPATDNTDGHGSGRGFKTQSDAWDRMDADAHEPPNPNPGGSCAPAPIRSRRAFARRLRQIAWTSNPPVSVP